ncbi:MAG: imidazole glycerol phosphate synthase subunit HisH [Bacteroidota bacterium]
MTVAVIKYNAGNIRSLSFALERLDVPHVITADPEIIRSADKVIFPGVGEAGSTMAHLKETGLDNLIRELKQPVLGICLGMQLLCRHSEENDTPCLGIFDADVIRLQPAPGIKVPHMGWNSLEEAHDWLDAGMDGASAYFVHSYFVPETEYTSAATNHGVRISAAMRRDNFYAVQFHPEKSAEAGRMVLKSFFNASR